jgi:hypothetical protein
LKDLAIVYESEQKKKNELEHQLKRVKQELEDIETQFPKEILDLKQKIIDAKKTTEEFEDKTKVLADELRILKTQMK